MSAKPVSNVPASDSAPDPSSPYAGNLEAKTAAVLEAMDAEGAEAELLGEQALTGARMTDDAVASGRPHLVGAGIRILNESLDRLKGLARRKNDHPNDDGGDDFLDQYLHFGNQ